MQVQEQKYWCVGKPSASEAELSANIEYGCSFERVNCSVIQEGGVCFYPNTLINHASVVMNLYYSSMGRNSWNCDFRSSALTVISNPSNNHYSIYIYTYTPISFIYTLMYSFVVFLVCRLWCLQLCLAS